MDAPSPPHRMFQMITGYWVSQLVGAVASLGIVDALEAGARRVPDLARELDVDPGALARLLRAGIGVGLFTRAEDGSWQATELGATLGAKHPGTMRGMAIAQTGPGHWLPWGRFTDAVRTGERQTLATLGAEIFDYYGTHPAEATAFNEAMHGLSSLAARELAERLEAPTKARIVDVGGARGTLLRALLAKWPDANGVLLDLPHVAGPMAVEARSWPESARVEVTAGDFFESVPGGDTFVLKQILHDWNDEQCVTILRNCVRAMCPRGRVVVLEALIPEDGRASPGALMDMNMLALLPGRERTLHELTDLLATAGLTVSRVSQTRSPFEIIEAVASASA
jgi:hypothetical protein